MFRIYLKGKYDQLTRNFRVIAQIDDNCRVCGFRQNKSLQKNSDWGEVRNRNTGSPRTPAVSCGRKRHTGITQFVLCLSLSLIVCLPLLCHFFFGSKARLMFSRCDVHVSVRLSVCPWTPPPWKYDFWAAHITLKQGATQCDQVLVFSCRPVPGCQAFFCVICTWTRDQNLSWQLQQSKA